MRPREKILYFLLPCIFILIPVSAFAQCSYTELLSGNKWTPGTVLGYTYNSEAEPIYGGFSVGCAASTWNAIDGTCYTFSNTGDLGYVMWIDSQSDWNSIPGSPSSDAAGATRCDFSGVFVVYLNVAYYQDTDWDASCTTSKIDIQSVMTHEFGHVLGLQEATSCLNSIMVRTIGKGDCRHTLADVDKRAIKSMCDDPAGGIYSFLPIYRNGVVEITWKITDHTADYYYLERKDSGGDEFKKIQGATFQPNRISNPSSYIYIDVEGDASSVYRLVEKDIHGNTFVHDIKQTLLPFEYNPNPEPDFDPEELYKELNKWAVMCNANRDIGLGKQSITEDWVAIGPLEYIDSPGVLSLAYWHEQYGLTTGITILQHIEDYWEGDLIAYLNYLSEHGTKYVMLVGDANDHELFDDPGVWAVNDWDEYRPDFNSQPEYDIISADYYLDQDPRETNMSYFTPYYASDMPKSDVNNDGYPELIIGRIPAHSVNDVLAYGAKAVKYLQDNGGLWVDDVSILINKWNVWGNDGALAETFGMSLLSYLPDEFTGHLLRNDCPDCCDCASYSVREWRACHEFNLGRSLIVTIGSGAHYYDLNYWFEVASGFDITKLNPNNVFPFLLAISCELGAFEKTESPDYGRPICERLLFDDDRGIIGMFAPTRGSWQTGNYLIGKLVLENLYTYGVPSLGHACALSQRDLTIQYPQYVDLARSYVYIGDPALQLFGSIITESQPPFCDIAINYSNYDFIFACPAGDAEEMQADLDFMFNFGDPYDILKEDIILDYSQDDGSFVIFSNDDIIAQSDAVAPDYNSTLTYEYFGGCGCDTVYIKTGDRPVGSAILKVKTCDLNASGKVELGDLNIFGQSYNKASSDSGFNHCCDFNGDIVCNLSDFSIMGEHYNEEHPWYQQNLLTSTSIFSEMTVLLKIEQVQRQPGELHLYVTIDLENAIDISQICMVLENIDKDIAFAGWTNGTEFNKNVLVSPANNGGREIMFIYAFGGKVINETMITMGTLEFILKGNTYIPISDDYFKLVIGDVLDGKGNIKKIQTTKRRDTIFDDTICKKNRLFANYPNPFNPKTIIRYSIAENSHVNLSIYNIAGQLILCLVNEHNLKGDHTAVWDGKDGNGNLVASGVYFYRLKTDTFSQSKKLVVIR